MARNWQLLLLAGTLICPAGAWADKKDSEKQRHEKWSQECGGDDERAEHVRGVVCAATGSTRVWENIVVSPRAWPGDFEREKEWRREAEREKDRREAWKEREKDRREAARESEKDRRKVQREWEKDVAAAAREQRRER